MSDRNWINPLTGRSQADNERDAVLNAGTSDLCPVCLNPRGSVCALCTAPLVEDLRARLAEVEAQRDAVAHDLSATVQRIAAERTAREAAERKLPCGHPAGCLENDQRFSADDPEWGGSKVCGWCWIEDCRQGAQDEWDRTEHRIAQAERQHAAAGPGARSPSRPAGAAGGRGRRRGAL